jgi:hypothetical protein
VPGSRGSRQSQKDLFAMATFRRWARYVRQTRGGTVDLTFSVSGDPQIEKAYRFPAYLDFLHLSYFAFNRFT